MTLIKTILQKVYILALMAFTVWFGYFIYPVIFGFGGKEDARDSLSQWGITDRIEENDLTRLITKQATIRKTDLGYRVIEQPYIEGHFHHIGFAVPEDARDACMGCHGSVPHHGSREIRGFLNMHSFFLACETCHVAPQPGAPSWEFRWYDKATGELTDNPRALLNMEETPSTRFTWAKFPAYGDYGAKILPTDGIEERVDSLHDANEIQLASRLVANLDRLGDEQRSQLQRLLHRALTETPILCPECHRETDPYLPLAQLGYPPRRVGDLTRTEVVGMVDSYQQFYLPDLLESPAREPDATKP